MPGVKHQRPIDLEWTLKNAFGKSSFRPLQREVIHAALDGHDVFLQAATSFGKSLCFQLPAVVDYGLTIVISPLLALMNNQIASLRAAKIPVATINSNITKDEKQAILEDLQCGHPHTKLLYVTPEYCALDFFRRILRTIYKQGQLCRIAIDEAHCISEWGHDFRPAFKDLNFFKQEFVDVPMICLTATATQRVRDDVVSTVGLNYHNLKIFTMTTSRPNLHYEVRFKSNEIDHYDDFLIWIKGVYKRRRQSTRSAELQEKNGMCQQRPDNVPGIIYVRYRLDCEKLAERLNEDGVGARPFHAGLPSDQKEDHLQGWAENKRGYDVIVATTAFGMGIDKSNVRFVVHWQIPNSFEGFYQEAGRAGRDGKASICIMYYGREDRDRTTSLLAKEVAKQQTISSAGGHERSSNSGGPSPQMQGRLKSLDALIRYSEATNVCRHKAISQYFGEIGADPPCEWACDFCKDKKDLTNRKKDGLASEEWCSTQRDSGAYAIDEYD